jgi:hypothetical protein
MISITLTQNEFDALMQPESGSGGFQSLLEKLQKQCNPKTKELGLYDDDRERIKRYMKEYGNGGWEERLKNIFENHSHLL